MDRLVVLSVVLCALSSGCEHVEGEAEAAAAPSTGEILGMVTDVESAEGGLVRLGAAGPTTRISEEGYFTFADVAPGCYDVHLVEGGRETLSLDGPAACVRAGQSLVLSIVFGRI